MPEAVVTTVASALAELERFESAVDALFDRPHATPADLAALIAAEAARRAGMPGGLAAEAGR